MAIKLGIAGKIGKGLEIGRYVKVIDDVANSGGFLIFTAASPDMQQDGFDCWVENGVCCEASLKSLAGSLNGNLRSV